MSHRPGTIARRTGDEIVVAGQFVHTGTPVVLWMDPAGYDAYRVERRFAPLDKSSWNTRSVGLEIANIGAYSSPDAKPLSEWYAQEDGRTRLKIPPSLGDAGIRTRGFVGRPARPELVAGEIQGQQLVQYDFTPEQY